LTDVLFLEGDGFFEGRGFFLKSDSFADLLTLTKIRADLILVFLESPFVT